MLLGLIQLAPHAAADESWTMPGWRTTTPTDVGLDARVLAAFDADISEGKYGYVDSMLVIRHGKIAFERYYGHDYDRIYASEMQTPSPLVVNDPGGWPWYGRALSCLI
jgi:hypothetical protein